MAQIKLKAVDESTPEGTRVALVDDQGVVHLTRTRTMTWGGGGRLLVAVVGRSGGYIASRCFVLTDEALELA